MKNGLLIWTAVAGVLILFFGFFSNYGMMPYRDYGMMGSYWTWGFGWMGVFMILLWVTFIVLLVLLIIYLSKEIKNKSK